MIMQIAGGKIEIASNDPWTAGACGDLTCVREKLLIGLVYAYAVVEIERCDAYLQASWNPHDS